MIERSRLIDKDGAEGLFYSLKQINDGYFVDRSKHIKNYGVNGEVGQYKTAFELPDGAMDKIFRKLAPKNIGKEELDMVLINKYKAGDWMPKHRDKTMHTTMTLLFLGYGTYLRFYIGDEVIEIEEEPGLTITVPTNLLHDVSGIDKERFVVLYMYK